MIQQQQRVKFKQDIDQLQGLPILQKIQKKPPTGVLQKIGLFGQTLPAKFLQPNALLLPDQYVQAQYQSRVEQILNTTFNTFLSILNRLLAYQYLKKQSKSWYVPLSPLSKKESCLLSTYAKRLPDVAHVYSSSYFASLTMPVIDLAINQLKTFLQGFRKQIQRVQRSTFQQEQQLQITPKSKQGQQKIKSQGQQQAQPKIKPQGQQQAQQKIKSQGQQQVQRQL
jgi:hypothetical protein